MDGPICLNLLRHEEMRAVLKHLFRDEIRFRECVLIFIIGAAIAGAHAAMEEYFKPYETSFTSRFLIGAAPFVIAFLLGRPLYYVAAMRKRAQAVSLENSPPSLRRTDA